MEKRKNHSNTIRKYLLQNDFQDDLTTEKDSEDSTTGSMQTITAETRLLDESNEAYLRAQNGFPIEGITCRG
eukprot:11190844-Ditylum_brightwellii.AAC.1